MFLKKDYELILDHTRAKLKNYLGCREMLLRHGDENTFYFGEVESKIAELKSDVSYYEREMPR